MVIVKFYVTHLACRASRTQRTRRVRILRRVAYLWGACAVRDEGAFSVLYRGVLDLNKALHPPRATIYIFRTYTVDRTTIL